MSADPEVFDQAYVEKAPVGIFVVNRFGEYIDVNPAACEMVGYTENELLDMSIRDLAASASESDPIPSFEEVKRTGRMRTEGSLLHKDGHDVHALIEAVVVRDERFVAYCQDITGRKQREQALQEREEKYRNLFEDTRDALMLLDRDGFFDCNEQTLELFGIDSVNEFLEYTPWELSPPRQPDGADSKTAALENVEQAFEEGEAVFEWTHRRADETNFSAEVKLSRFEYQGKPALHALVRDITDSKEYERRLKQQRDNLDVLNQVLRHDIRNDLQLVSAYAEMLADECDDEDVLEYIETVSEATTHAAELTVLAQEMADVMLSEGQDLESVDLREILDTEIDEIRSAYPSAVVTSKNLIPSVTVRANDMLESVFGNILKNAVQHNDSAVPELTVSTLERNEMVVVRIADNGPGVPDEQKNAIFGKGERGLESEGTGIGLYLVETLVEKYGGDVWVEDADSGGAVFSIELPKVTHE
jgi:PAS domain S-box-containing protein